MSEVNGLVFFNANGAAGAIVRLNGAERRLFGTYDDSVVELADKAGNSIMLRRLERESEKHPAARGTISFEGTGKAIVAFINQTPEGRRVLGISEALKPAEPADVNW